MERKNEKTEKKGKGEEKGETIEEKKKKGKEKMEREKKKNVNMKKKERKSSELHTFWAGSLLRRIRQGWLLVVKTRVT